MNSLDEVLEKLKMKVGLIYKMEHIREPTELIKVYTVSKVYTFAYYPNKELRLFVEKDGEYVEFKLLKGKATYEEFDKIFMTILDCMYKKWGGVYVYEMPSFRKTIVHPLYSN